MDITTLLNQTLPGKFLLPNTDAYETSNHAYFTVFGYSLRPSAIAQPSTTEEVSTLIAALNPLLQNKQLRIAIRGTGHTPFAGSANINDGVTIDLRGLKGIKLNEDKSVVEIGVGETWGSVYTELEKYGLTAAGGRVGRVGVGGLISWRRSILLFYRRGFACDSVLEFSVVLASGQVVRANATEHASLFTALKGGLNNFGIVTSFKMRTFSSGNIWGGAAFYAPDSYALLAEAIVDFATNETDQDTHIIAGAVFGHGREAGNCCMYQTKGVEEAASLKRFTETPGRIEGYGNLRTGTHLEFCQELSDFTKDDCRSFYASLTIKPDVSLLKDLHKAWCETLSSLQDAQGFIFALSYLPLSQSLLTASAAAGGNAKDIDPADGPLLVVLINPAWESAADDARVYAGVEKLLATCKQLARQKGMLHRYVFTNYAFEKENLFKGYGERSLERMRGVSREVDPQAVFQKAVEGSFKLGM